MERMTEELGITRTLVPRLHLRPPVALHLDPFPLQFRMSIAAPLGLSTHSSIWAFAPHRTAANQRLLGLARLAPQCVSKSSIGAAKPAFKPIGFITTATTVVLGNPPLARRVSFRLYLITVPVKRPLLNRLIVAVKTHSCRALLRIARLTLVLAIIRWERRFALLGWVFPRRGIRGKISRSPQPDGFGIVAFQWNR